jgi:hypothetical protein
MSMKSFKIDDIKNCLQKNSKEKRDVCKSGRRPVHCPGAGRRRESGGCRSRGRESKLTGPAHTFSQSSGDFGLHCTCPRFSFVFKNSEEVARGFWFWCGECNIAVDCHVRRCSADWSLVWQSRTLIGGFLNPKSARISKKSEKFR